MMKGYTRREALKSALTATVMVAATALPTPAVARGIRNNNPLNIKRTAVKWEGEIKGKDKVFATFESPLKGLRAAAKLLYNYYEKHKLDTIPAIIARWAPHHENDTKKYSSFVTKFIPVKNGEKLSLKDEQQLCRLLQAMIQYENGSCPYSTELLQEAVREARL